MSRVALLAVVALVVGCSSPAREPPQDPKPRPVLPPLVCQGLCGRVLWPSGEPAYEADVIMTHADGSEDVKVTGEDGVFDFPDAPVGSYALAVLQGSRRFPDVAVTRTAEGPQQLPDITIDEPNGCTLLGCEDGITIQLAAPKRAWPAGTYQFRLDLDGEVVTCDGAVPLAACVDGDTDAARCPTNDHWAHVTSDCEHRDRFATIRIGKPAKTIEVEISQQGRVAGFANYKPTYTVSHPNGPDPECGSCTSAEDETLRLDFSR
jgi:hypothetical protein